MRAPPLGLEEIAFGDVRAGLVDHFEKLGSFEVTAY